MTVLSGDLREKAELLVGRYPVGRSALLPLLHLVQSQDGYVSDEGVAEIAALLALTKAEVGAVATFYTMYKRAPMGRHLVSVCTNFSCKVRGAEEVYERLHQRLGVGHNGTTQDGAITLEHAECLGNCEGAPVVSVDYLNYECLSPDAAQEIVERVAAGEVPPPTRGFPSTGIRATSHRLAGLGPFDSSTEDRASIVCTASQQRPAPTGGGARRDAVPDRDPDRVPPRESHEQPGTSVREAGLEPDDVERESGYSGREMPTTDHDEGSEAGGAADPRRDDQTAGQREERGDG